MILITFSSCENDKCDSFPDTEPVTLEYINYENDFKNRKSDVEIQQFLDANKSLKEGFLMGNQYPDSFVVDYLQRVNTSGGIDTIYKECKETYGDFGKWIKEFEDAFSLLNYYFPKEKSRSIATFIPGLMRDLHIDDSTVVIGIDYFLGPKATFRPQNFNYINKRYIPEAIVPMSMVFLSTKYNLSEFADKSLLAEMLYYGKSFYFSKKMLPCVADSLIIGYSKEEWKGSEKHTKDIWSYFVEKELLFETNHVEKKRYIEERPAVTEIGNKCPGRIGQWLGWKIIKAYAENNPDISLAEIMAEKDSKKILEYSKFKP